MVFNSQSYNYEGDIICINDTKIWPCSIYKHYAYCEFAFNIINIYKYLKFDFMEKQSQKQDTDYKFNNSHK